MVMHRQSRVAAAVSESTLVQVLALFVLLTFSINVFADSDADKRLEEQMEQAREQLDTAAQRVAELSREMAGGEVARVVKRMSVGHRKAMLGVRIDDAKAGDGVLIESVTKEGPAERAGVQAGDLVQSINDVDLTKGSRSDAIEGLLKTLKELEPNDVASLGIRRDGRDLNIDVTTESVAKALPRFGAFTDSEGNLQQVSEILENLAVNLPEMHADIQIDGDFSQFELDEGQVEELKQLPRRLEEAMGKLSNSGPVIAMLGGSTGLGHHFQFAPITPGLGDYFGVKRGVLLTSVPEDSTQGLEEGDVLLAVNGEPVDSRHEVHAAFAQAEEGDTLAVELVRQRQSLTVDVTKPANSWGRVWNCLSGSDTKGEREHCTSKDGSSFKFRFSTDDETDNDYQPLLRASHSPRTFNIGVLSRTMRRDDFTFTLPEHLIARRPPDERRDSRLLALPANSEVVDRAFCELPTLVKPGDLLVFNNSKVIPARVFGVKQSGGKIEVLLERIQSRNTVLAKIRASKSPKTGAVLYLNAGTKSETVVVAGREHDLYVLEFASDPLAFFLEYGEMPLPPYIDRRADDADSSRYQTVYADPLGSVAAPTAGLHFDQSMLDELDAAGIERGHVTLHVGSGTYQPVRAENLEDHVMHSEHVEVSERLVEQVKRVKAAGGDIVCVGTTSLRCLEAASQSGQLEAFSGETDIFIYPGYRFRTADRLMTNFHLPESSLLMLVSALAGRERILDAYAHAVSNGYRFFSYGDCMLIDKHAVEP